jgi:hypothetical protein
VRIISEAPLLYIRCFRCCNWGHYATERRDPPAPEHIQKSAIEQWKISLDKEQNRRNIPYQSISNPPPYPEPHGQQRNKQFEYPEGSQKSKIEEIPNAETIDQKGKSVRFGKSNCIEIESSELKGMKFSESFNLGGITSTLPDIMAAEKRDQFKVIDIDDEPPRIRQRTRLMENNNDDNRGASVSWPPASAQPILLGIPPRPSNVGPVSENLDTLQHRQQQKVTSKPKNNIPIRMMKDQPKFDQVTAFRDTSYQFYHGAI